MSTKFNEDNGGSLNLTQTVETNRLVQKARTVNIVY